DDLVKTLSYDMKIGFNLIDGGLVRELEALEPYGVANPRPVFRTDNCMVKNICYLKGGKHVKLVLEEGGKLMEAIYFNSGEYIKETLDNKDRISILYSLKENSWKGIDSIQLNLIDLF
ncbi:MAG: hypothetical protein ACQEP5_03695, partial [Actinomycetota bacterium]